jgi:hypothetical protein
MRSKTLPKKVALVCNYSVWCSGTRNCEKCRFLMELKVAGCSDSQHEAVESACGG